MIQGMYRSALLSMGASWVVKSLGLISTIILARILAPEDFAALAIIIMVLYFFELFSMHGTRQYILSLDKVDDIELNTSFSLNVLTRILIVGFVILAGDVVMRFFGYAHLYSALCVSSLSLLISAFFNPRNNILRRELQYEKIFLIDVTSKLGSFLVTILLAYIWESYWAMVVGSVCNSLIGCIVSYWVNPYKPSFELSRWKPQWGFTKWIYLNSFISYIRAKTDLFVLAKFYTSQELGLFTIAKELAMLVYQQVALPLNEIIIVSFRKSVSDGVKASDVFLQYYTMIFSIVFSLSFFVSFYAESIVLILLGQKWIGSIQLVIVLSFLGFVSAIISYIYSVLNAIKRVKERFYYDSGTAVIISMLIFFGAGIELIYFCALLVIITFLNLIGFLFLIRRYIEIRLISVFISSMPAVISGVLVFCLNLFLPVDFALFDLNFFVRSFALIFSYLVILGFLFYAFSFNSGVHFVFNQIKKYIFRLLSRQ